MKNKVLKICNSVIHPGEKNTLALALPELYTCSPMYMPIKIIHGKKPGPIFLVTSAIKGNEFNGLEIVNQLYDQISADELSGTLIAVPVLNVYGLTHFPKLSPSDINLSNSFPGDAIGTFNERVAYLFTEEILKKADYCIELQTGSMNHDIYPQLYFNFDYSSSKKLAKAFQAPVITEVNSDISTFRVTAESLSLPFIVYEAWEAMRFDQTAIQIGLEGILNIMKKIDMLEGSVDQQVTPVFSKDDDWVIAHGSGILHAKVNLGEKVKTGNVIGVLSDPFSNENVTKVKAHIDGVIVGVNRSPLIQEGNSIFKIASFIDNEKARSMLEEWEEQLPETEE